jgi:anti-sigma factor ChrR (cupin superfamily)
MKSRREARTRGGQKAPLLHRPKPGRCVRDQAGFAKAIPRDIGKSGDTYPADGIGLTEVKNQKHTRNPIMEINADFTRRAVVHSQDIPWVASPMPGVDRRMLDRIGDEVARATSIVRYAPGSAFSAHTHTGGEEYLVLDGVFQDEHGDFPVGTYVRNPPTSRHTPRSAEGATILVKLWQFDPEDRTQVTIDTHAQIPVAVSGRPGVSEIPLFEDARERVRIEIWEPGTEVQIADHSGIEILVISGSFSEAGETFRTQSWLRLPKGQPLIASAGAAGARVWVKSDHLSEIPMGSPANARSR